MCLNYINHEKKSFPSMKPCTVVLLISFDRTVILLRDRQRKRLKLLLLRYSGEIENLPNLKSSHVENFTPPSCVYMCTCVFLPCLCER